MAVAEGTRPDQGLVTEADVRAAQTVLDQLVEVLEGREDGSWLTRAAMLELRGLLAAWSADVRWAGYLEGKVRGRQLLAAAVHEVLEVEGL